MTLAALQAKSDYDAAKASLEKVAKGSDANAAAAKRALAAMAESAPPAEDDDKKDEPDAESDEEKPDAEGDEDKKPDAEGDTPAPAAEGDDMPPDDEPAKKKAAAPAPPATASSNATELALAARVHKLEAMAAARDERDTRRALLAKRPDFGPELRAALAKAPLDTVRELVRTLPKFKPVAKRTAPITTVAALRGVTQTNDEGGPEAEELDRRMGLRGQAFGCKREGNVQLFGLVADKDRSQPTAAASAKGQAS